MGLFKRIVRKITNIIKKHQRIYNVLSRIRNALSSVFTIKADLQFHQNLKIMVNQIPKYRENSYYNKSNTTFAIITDEFMYNYYKDAVNLIYITPSNYIEVIDNQKIDYVMFISCWKGIGESTEWRGKEARNKVVDVLEYSRNKGIESIFQTIEDPSNYNEYLHIAKAADYIFTTAIECINDYKQDAGNENVFLLEYGINPALHNPIGCFNKYNDRQLEETNNSVFFAGTWTNRYRERCEDLKELFDGVFLSESNLVIADRNYYIQGYRFPMKYAKSVIPPIEHRQLQNTHKLFKYNLNVNSIKYSDTMCAMRVYEVQALGGLMISNYSLAVSNKFPNIFIALTKEYVAEVINAYSENQLRVMQALSIRNVYTNYTVYDRLNYIFEKINCPISFNSKKVFVLCNEKNADVLAMVNNQTYNNIDVLTFEEAEAKGQNDGYVLLYDADKEYNRYYIQDMINAFKYTNEVFVEYNNEKAYEYVDQNTDIYASLYDLSKVSVNDINDNLRNGFAIYNANIINVQLTIKKSYKLGIIIPVYNNGIYLRDRCFNSLVRSTLFDNMAIYIIDDGSTDQETLSIIEDLDCQYQNVYTYFFGDGGSGSASRPRNKGVELCKEEYLTYLDPDNEAINDGYSKLFSIIKDTAVDMAFGTIVKIKDNVNPLSYYNKDCLIENPKEDLLKRSFRTQSIQACVVKRKLIVDNQIKNPDGALGQDTLFFHELMLNAKKVYHTTLPIHLYYAQRGTSALNAIGVSFFQKFKKLEEYQVKVYKKYGVLQNYIDSKLEYFMENWYEEKLKYVHDSNLEDCKKIVDDIRNLYLGD